MSQSHLEPERSWRALLGREYRSAVTVLAGGVLLFATNVYVTISLLPSAVADIGGEHLFAWAMTAFLLTAVVASMFVSRLLARHGARTAYLIATGLFTLGTIIAAIAPTMPLLLAGRGVQGLGGGLLAGLGYAVIRQILPEPLRNRGLGAVSAMWGVGNLVGPSVGGLFSQFGVWRLAFVALALGSAALGLLAARTMPDRRTQGDTGRLPVLALAAVTVAAVAVSIAGVVHGWAGPLLLAGGAVLLVAFVLRERVATHRVLPAATYRRGSALKWVYASLALLAVGSTTETFIPLFGQELGGLGAFLAGLLGASLSFGWTLGSIWASGIEDPRGRDRVRVFGPVLLAIGLAGYAALQQSAASGWIVVAWAGTLLVAGAGIGMAFQHGVTAAMASTSDEAEATRAAAGVTTVQEMSNALGSAVAGVLVNLGASTVQSAHLLNWSFVAVAVVAVYTAFRANSGLRRQDGPNSARAAPTTESVGASA